MEKENKHNHMSETTKAMESAAETLGNTIIAVLDRLAGKKSDLKLSFEDLTFDTGMFKARINGAIILETTMAKESEISA
jgi:hypothetical protein